MLGVILVAASVKDRGQGRLVVFLANRTIRVFFAFSGLLLVALDQACNELRKEDGTPIAQDGAILLRAVRFNLQIRVIDNTALEHDSARLVDRDLLVAKTSKVVGDAPIRVNDRLLAFASVNLLNDTPKIFVKLLRDLLIKVRLVDEGDGLRHCLHHLFV